MNLDIFSNQSNQYDNAKRFKAKQYYLPKGNIDNY